MKTKEEQDQARAKSQAEAQLSSIREMVAALDRETAAKAYADALDIEKVKALLDEHIGTAIHANLPEDEARELLADKINEESIEPGDFEFNQEDAQQAIQEDALSVEVRSGWESSPDELKPQEYAILLCTGGPACRIIGSLGEYGDPESASIQYQDWFTPWVDYPLDREEEADVVKYAQQFYFGQ